MCETIWCILLAHHWPLNIARLVYLQFNGKISSGSNIFDANCIYNAVTPQRQSQFTSKMKANAVPRLLSSLVWIDQYNECNGMTSFMEFMSNTLHYMKKLTSGCMGSDHFLCYTNTLQPIDMMYGYPLYNIVCTFFMPTKYCNNISCIVFRGVLTPFGAPRYALV